MSLTSEENKRMLWQLFDGHPLKNTDIDTFQSRFIDAISRVDGSRAGYASLVDQNKEVVRELSRYGPGAYGSPPTYSTPPDVPQAWPYPTNRGAAAPPPRRTRPPSAPRYSDPTYENPPAYATPSAPRHASQSHAFHARPRLSMPPQQTRHDPLSHPAGFTSLRDPATKFDALLEKHQQDFSRMIHQERPPEMDFKATAPQPASRNVDMTLHERASELNRIMGGYDKDSAASWLKEGNKPSSDGIKIHQRSNVVLGPMDVAAPKQKRVTFYGDPEARAHRPHPMSAAHAMPVRAPSAPAAPSHDPLLSKLKKQDRPAPDAPVLAILAALTKNQEQIIEKLGDISTLLRASTQKEDSTEGSPEAVQEDAAQASSAQADETQADSVQADDATSNEQVINPVHSTKEDVKSSETAAVEA